MTAEQEPGVFRTVDGLPDVLLTTAEAAAIMRCAPRTVSEWCAGELIDHVCVGRRYLVPRSAVDRWIRDHMVRRAPALRRVS